MNGLHLLANLFECDFYPLGLEGGLLERVRTICSEQGLTVVGEASYAFSPQGTTLTLLLAESHCTVHTWPERKEVVLDLYTCNFQTDNTLKTLRTFAALLVLFSPRRTLFQAMDRNTLQPLIRHTEWPLVEVKVRGVMEDRNQWRDTLW